MKPSDTTDVDTRPKPTNDEIAARAYAIFLARGGQFGDGLHDADWRQAEDELLAARRPTNEA